MMGLNTELIYKEPKILSITSLLFALLSQKVFNTKRRELCYNLPTLENKPTLLYISSKVHLPYYLKWEKGLYFFQKYQSSH